MTILPKIDADFKEAMKAKNEIVISVLRLMRTALKNKQIEAQHDLSEQEATAVLKTLIKQYQDALADFKSAGRRDLEERQQQEIDIVARYLPPPMDSATLEKIVREALTESGITEIGKAMGVAMKAVKGQADGNEVRRVVEQILGS